MGEILGIIYLIVGYWAVGVCLYEGKVVFIQTITNISSNISNKTEIEKFNISIDAIANIKNKFKKLQLMY